MNVAEVGYLDRTTELTLFLSSSLGLLLWIKHCKQAPYLLLKSCDWLSKDNNHNHNYNWSIISPIMHSTVKHQYLPFLYLVLCHESFVFFPQMFYGYDKCVRTSMMSQMYHYSSNIEMFFLEFSYIIFLYKMFLVAGQ